MLLHALKTSSNLERYELLAERFIRYYHQTAESLVASGGIPRLPSQTPCASSLTPRIHSRYLSVLVHASSASSYGLHRLTCHMHSWSHSLMKRQPSSPIRARGYRTEPSRRNFGTTPRDFPPCFTFPIFHSIFLSVCTRSKASSSSAPYIS